MNARDRSLLIALALAASTALILALPRGEAEPPWRAGEGRPGQAPDTVSARAERQELERAGEELEGLYTAPIGTRLTFDFELDTRAAMTSREILGKGAGQQSGLRFTGDLVVVVRDRRADEILLDLTAGDPRLETGTGADVRSHGTFAEQTRHLGEPFALRMAPDGQTLAYRFSPATTGLERSLLRNLVSAFRFVVPVDVRASWKATESDATGTFEAEYQGNETEDGIWVLRRKLHYTSLAEVGGRTPSSRTAGQARARFSAALRWLQEATVDESLRIGLAESFEMEAALKGTLRLAAVEQVPVDLQGDPWAGPWAAASGQQETLVELAAASEEARWAAKLEGVTLQDLTGRLQALFAAGDLHTQAFYEAWQELSWLLRLQPDLVGEVEGMLLGQQHPDEIASALLTAIGKAGHPTAQRALVSLSTDAKLPAALRTVATIAMTEVASPTAELLGSLLGTVQGATTMDETGSTGLLVLGALSTRSNEPLSGSATAFDALVALEERARTLGGSDVWLQALGNSRSPRALELARPYGGAPEHHVRAAAAAAVAGDDSRQATDFLLQLALGDPEPRVRMQAVESLASARGNGRTDALVKVLLDDPDAGVRRTALRGLADAGSLDASSRAALEQVAHADPAERIRRLAQQILAGS